MLHHHYGNSQIYFRVRDLAREMRKNPTRAEKIFWEKTRNRLFHGLKINRQFILALRLDQRFTKYYIADFYCHKLRLIIELDGPIHLECIEKDLIRTEMLHDFGYDVLRFSNDDVINNWQLVESVVTQKIHVVGRSINSFPDPFS